MRKLVPIFAVFVIAAGVFGQTTKPQALSNTTISAAVVAMEKEYRTALPSNATSAQIDAAEKARDAKAKAIMDGLRALPAGKVDFVVDDVIRRKDTPPNSPAVNPNPVLRFNETLNNRENDKQNEGMEWSEFRVVGHLEWKTVIVGAASPDNQPTQKITVLSSDLAIGKWKVGEKHQMTVTCDSIQSRLVNTRTTYTPDTSRSGSALNIKPVVSYAVAYVELSLKLIDEATKPVPAK